MPRRPACAIELSDLVSNNVRTRLLAPLVILLAVFTIGSVIFASLIDDNSYVSKTTFIMPPPSTNLRNISTTYVPSSRILDQNGRGFPNVSVLLVVSDLVTGNPEAVVDCTMDTMTRRTGGLDWIRYHEACDPNTREIINSTNELVPALPHTAT